MCISVEGRRKKLTENVIFGRHPPTQKYVFFSYFFCFFGISPFVRSLLSMILFFESCSSQGKYLFKFVYFESNLRTHQMFWRSEIEDVFAWTLFLKCLKGFHSYIFVTPGSIVIKEMLFISLTFLPRILGWKILILIEK